MTETLISPLFQSVAYRKGLTNHFKAHLRLHFDSFNPTSHFLSHTSNICLCPCFYPCRLKPTSSSWPTVRLMWSSSCLKGSQDRHTTEVREATAPQPPSASVSTSKQRSFNNNQKQTRNTESCWKLHKLTYGRIFLRRHYGSRTFWFPEGLVWSLKLFISLVLRLSLSCCMSAAVFLPALFAPAGCLLICTLPNAVTAEHRSVQLL